MEIRVHHFVLLIFLLIHPELARSASYTAFISDLKSKNCSFPDPYFYDPEVLPPGQSPALKNCEVLLPDTPLTAPLSSLLLSAREVCFKFFSFAQAMCQPNYKGTADQFLKAEALRSQPKYDNNKTVCWYAATLPEKFQQYMPPFMLNQTACSQVCTPGLQPDFLPVCQLLVSTMCQLNEEAPGCVPVTTSEKRESESGNSGGDKVSPGPQSGAASSADVTASSADVTSGDSGKPEVISADTDHNKTINEPDEVKKNTSTPENSRPANNGSVSESKTENPPAATAKPAENPPPTTKPEGTPAATAKPVKIAVTTKVAAQSTEMTTKGTEIKKAEATKNETKPNTPVPVAKQELSDPNSMKVNDSKTLGELSTKSDNITALSGAGNNTALSGAGQNTPSGANNNTLLPGANSVTQNDIKAKTGPPEDNKAMETTHIVSEVVTTVPAATTKPQQAQTTMKGDIDTPQGSKAMGTTAWEETDDLNDYFDLNNKGRGGASSPDRSKTSDQLPGETLNRPYPSRNDYGSSRVGQNHRVHTIPTGQDSPSSGHFFAYFLTAVVICISGYVIFHNKQKIVAYIIEGRSGGRNGRRRSGSGPKYSQLKSSVEEVMPSLESATTSKNFVY